MARNELTMELKVEGLNEAIEKAKQLNEFLEKAQSLIDSLSNHKTESEIEIKGTLEKQLQLLKERSENAEDRSRRVYHRENGKSRKGEKSCKAR